ncbi:MAG: glycosyltransferase family 39 protein [Planctomycetes bacterium]|nr:glycosyltransferase family 39 protein [Planctomycetota bacterium]
MLCGDLLGRLRIRGQRPLERLAGEERAATRDLGDERALSAGERPLPNGELSPSIGVRGPSRCDRAPPACECALAIDGRASAIDGRAFSIILAGLLAGFLLLRLAHIDADAPVDLCRDHSLTVDGSWYAARALDDTLGRKCDIARGYDRPVFTAYASAVFRWLGPTVASAHLLSIAPGLVAVLFTALAARRLHGDACGLISAGLLGSSYAFFVFNRSPVIYTFVAMVAAIVVWLSVRGRQERSGASTAAAWILLAAGILLVKEILILLAPALLFIGPIPLLGRGAAASAWNGAQARDAAGTSTAAGAAPFARMRPVAWKWLIAAGAVFGAAAAVAMGGLGTALAQKLHDYFLRGDDLGLLARLLSLEHRSGLIAAAPVLVLLAAGRALAGPATRIERGLAAATLAGVLALALLSYSPLRYFLVFFPSLAVLAAGALAARGREDGCPEKTPARLRRLSAAALSIAARGREDGCPEETPGRLRRLSAAALSIAAALYLAHQIVLALHLDRGGAIAGVLAWSMAAAALCGLVLLVRRGRRFEILRRPAVLGLVAAALVLPDLARTSRALAAPERTISDAAREMECIVSPGAVISGLFAHALTTGNRIDRSMVEQVRYGGGRLGEIYRARGITHLALELDARGPQILAIFEADGAALVPVHAFRLRGTPVGVFRFARIAAGRGGGYELSDFEKGIEALRRGDIGAARAHLERSARLHPEASAPREALSEAARQAGTPREALSEAARQAGAPREALSEAARQAGAPPSFPDPSPERLQRGEPAADG